MPLDEEKDCPRCHAVVSTDEGCEPTEFCHHCAQEIAAAACKLVRLPNAANRVSGWGDINDAFRELERTVNP